MTKPTKEQMKARAYAIAESQFYSDEECQFVFEPLEDLDENVVHDLMIDVAEAIYYAMVWAQGDDDE
jgi:hypothetical protein